MTAMKNHQKKFTSLLQDYSNLISAIYPFRDSFHAFLVEHDIHAWEIYNVSNEKTTPESYQYNLSMNPMTEQGYRFVLANPYVDEAGSANFSFIVPFSYVDNPQAWIDSLWTRVADEQEIANDAYDGIAPGLRIGMGFHVKIVNSSSGYLYCMVERKDGTRIYRNDPMRQMMKARKFIVHVETREVSGIML